MRLRTWIAVAISVVLLVSAGAIALLVNRSALHAADQVHRADAAALGANNATLAGALQQFSAEELAQFLSGHSLNLGRADPGDRRKLIEFAAKSAYFRYGVSLIDPAGHVLNGTLSSAELPAADDPGYGPMRAMLGRGQVGYSSLMIVNGYTKLAAVAVPVQVGGATAAILIGYNEVAKTQLQQYAVRLNADTHLTVVVDSTGRVAASGRPELLGSMADPAVIAALSRTTGADFVSYTSGGTKMIAVVVTGVMPGGWALVRTQTVASFYGTVARRSQTLNVILLAMLLIGVIGLTLLGYRTQVQRRRSEERFQALFQHAPDMVAVVDAQGRIAYSSPSAAAVLGLQYGSMQGRSIFELVHPQDRAEIQTEFAALLTEDAGVLRMRCRVLDAAGDSRWFEFTASNQMHNAALAGVVINARDISDNKAFEQRLAHEAEHDPLTGLPNRRRMQDVLEKTLQSEAVAVLFVDLDGFKPVNDAYGHAAGDELLRQVAHRLAHHVRAQDVLARVGGDEFVLLMPGVTDPQAAAAMSERFRAATAQPFDINGARITIGASVGLHLAAPATDSDQALRAADDAMYEVKRAGKLTA